jgi:type II secretory pathway component PulM
MRALTAKERKLLFFLLGAIFLLLNVVGLRAFLDRQQLLASSIMQLRVQLDEDRVILADRVYWEERRAWLEANQPVDDVNTVEDDTKFTEFIETSAKNHGLEYTRRGGGPMPPRGSIAEVYDSSTVKGPVEAVVKWLSELQKPKDFRVIKELRVKSGEPPEIICDVVVARWYRPTNVNKETP